MIFREFHVSKRKVRSIPYKILHSITINIDNKFNAIASVHDNNSLTILKIMPQMQSSNRLCSSSDITNSFLCVYTQGTSTDVNVDLSERSFKLELLFETQNNILKYHHFDTGYCHSPCTCECTNSCDSSKKEDCSGLCIRPILTTNAKGTVVRDKDMLLSYLRNHLKYGHVPSDQKTYKLRLFIYDGEWYLHQDRHREEWCKLPPLILNKKEQTIGMTVFMDQEIVYKDEYIDCVVDNLSTLIWKFR